MQSAYDFPRDYSPAQAAMRRGGSVFTDPGTLFSASVAGALGRLGILPLQPFVGHKDKSLLYSMKGRARQTGVLFWFYLPVHRRVQYEEPDQSARARMLRTFWTGFKAGAVARILLNPIQNIEETALRHHMGFFAAIQHIWHCQMGFISFFENQPTILGFGLFSAVFFTAIEGIRRYLERLFDVPVDSYLGNAVLNGVSGGLAMACASTIMFHTNSKHYKSNLIVATILSRGRKPTLLKEVPLAAATIFIFSLIQPLVCPHYERSGFGC